jgi:HAMP domain-containing protein
MLARGLHRRVLGFLFVASCVGAAAGVVAHGAFTNGSNWHGFACIGASFFFIFWWLSWAATFRIAWPVKELADVARDLRGGRLESKHDLPEGTGEVGEVANALRGMADRVGRQLQDQRALMAAVSHGSAAARPRARARRDGARGPRPRACTTISSRDRRWIGSWRSARGRSNRLRGDLAAGLDAATRLDGRSRSRICRRRRSWSRGRGTVRADPTLLPRDRRAPDNARYGGRTIQLHVHDLGERVRFEVTDDGPGFGPGELEQAFQPFFRGVAERRAQAGGRRLGWRSCDRSPKRTTARRRGPRRRGRESDRAPASIGLLQAGPRYVRPWYRSMPASMTRSSDSSTDSRDHE